MACISCRRVRPGMPPWPGTAARSARTRWQCNGTTPAHNTCCAVTVLEEARTAVRSKGKSRAGVCSCVARSMPSTTWRLLQQQHSGWRHSRKTLAYTHMQSQFKTAGNMHARYKTGVPSMPAPGSGGAQQCTCCSAKQAPGRRSRGAPLAALLLLGWLAGGGCGEDKKRVLPDRLAQATPTSVPALPWVALPARRLDLGLAVRPQAVPGICRREHGLPAGRRQAHWRPVLRPGACARRTHGPARRAPGPGRVVAWPRQHAHLVVLRCCLGLVAAPEQDAQHEARQLAIQAARPVQHLQQGADEEVDCVGVLVHLQGRRAAAAGSGAGTPARVLRDQRGAARLLLSASTPARTPARALSASTPARAPARARGPCCWARPVCSSSAAPVPTPLAPSPAPVPPSRPRANSPGTTAGRRSGPRH